LRVDRQEGRYGTHICVPPPEVATN
jgi:hypothetical protein